MRITYFFVGPRQHIWGKGQAYLLRRLQVYVKFKSRRLLNGKLARLLPFSIYRRTGRPPKHRLMIGKIRHKRPRLDILS